MSEIQLLIKDYEVEANKNADKIIFKLKVRLQGQRTDHNHDTQIEVEPVDENVIKYLQKAKESGAKLYLKIAIPQNSELIIVNTVD